MQVHFIVNGNDHSLDVHPGELLRTALRRLRYYSVKFGDEHALSGADAVLLTLTPDQPRSYRLVNSGGMLAVQADGASIITAEGLSSPRDHDLHPLQEQFVACGAIQCGYCTPAQLLAAKQLLDENPRPSEAEVREALAGVLCRCTGYLKPVEAVLRAAAQLRGEDVPAYQVHVIDAPESDEWPTSGDAQDGAGGDGSDGDADTQTRTKTVPVKLAPPETVVVNKSEPKVDAVKLVKGRAVFADDMETARHALRRPADQPARPRPHQAHRYQQGTRPARRPRRADLQGRAARACTPPAARAIPTRRPTTRSASTTRCATWATVWRSSPPKRREILQQALELIEVEYEVLPAVFDPDAAMQPGAPVIHDEPDAVKIHDAERNLVHHLDANHGDVEAALAKAAHVYESEYTRAAGAADADRAARRALLVGRGRPPGDPHQHAGALPRAPHGRPTDRPARCARSA